MIGLDSLDSVDIDWIAFELDWIALEFDISGLGC